MAISFRIPNADDGSVREHFYQHDRGQRVYVDGAVLSDSGSVLVPEDVLFTAKGLDNVFRATTVVDADGNVYATVPNSVLDEGTKVYVYAYDTVGETGRQEVIATATFSVKARGEMSPIDPTEEDLEYIEQLKQQIVGYKEAAYGYSVDASNSASDASASAEMASESASSASASADAASATVTEFETALEEEIIPNAKQELDDYSFNDTGSIASRLETYKGTLEGQLSTKKTALENELSAKKEELESELETNAEETIEEYVDTVAKPSIATFTDQNKQAISNYANSTVLPTLLPTAKTQIDSYVATTVKPDIDSYAEDVVDNFLDEKKSEIESATTAAKAVVTAEGNAQAERIQAIYEDDLAPKMERYIIYLLREGSTWKIEDVDGNTLSYDELLAHIRNIGEYVVMLYGNIKLRPQYVSTSEMQFTGVSRDSQGAYTHRVVMTATSVRYDAIELADAGELKLAENRIAVLESENSALKAENREQTLINARQSRQIENLNDRLDGDLIENKFKMTGETPDDAGVLSLPSSKLLPYAEVDEVHGRTVKSKNLIQMSNFTNTDNYNPVVPCTLEKGKTYTISGKSSSVTTLKIHKKDGSYQYLANNLENGIPTTFISDDDADAVSFYNRPTFINLQIEEGTVATAYEPYFEGLRNSIVNRVKSVGKNLLRTSTKKGTGTFTLEDDADIPSGEYTISCVASQRVGTSVGFTHEDGSKTWISLAVDTVRKSAKVTLPTSAKKVEMYVASQTVFSEIMLEKGEEPTSYTPYREPSTFAIPTDWYQKSQALGYDLGMEGTVINLKDKKVTWTYGKYTFDGTENGAPWGANGSFIIYKNAGQSSRSECLCNILPYTNDVYGGTTGIAINTTSQIAIRDTSKATSWAEWQSYFRTHEVTIVFERATPITKTFEELGMTPIDNGLRIESNGTITVECEGAQAEAKIHYAIDNRSKA